MTFEDIMNYYPTNLGVFESILKNYSSIVPFVGAGLSAFAYPTWRSFLEDTFEKLQWEEKRQSFKKGLDKYKYEKAASFLKKERGVVSFNSDIRQAYEKKLENNDFLSRQAVYLLPMLFKGLVLTTNFDHILEAVYDIHNISFDIGLPGHKEMLNTALREANKPTLYKLHGDISEVETFLVLTKENYDLYYAPGGDLVKELRKCFNQKIMLFLGCSLNKDRTMLILESILEAGIENYAIIPCNELKIRIKNRDLGNRHIRCIFYPDKQHECVRIILERLLELIDKASYQSLFFNYSNINVPDRNRFTYDSECVNFFGREKETEMLKEFCNSNNGVKWWAITGNGGSGKSRLVYEFKNKLDPNKWNVSYPNQYDYEGLKEISLNIKKNTLFIIDYVRAYSKDIGKWIEMLYNTKSSIIKRIILIERDGRSIEDAIWVREIINGVKSVKSITQSCYNELFIFLNQLDSNDTIKIMMSFAYNNRYSLSYDEAKSLYKALDKIDPYKTRPLYALFLVSAYLNNKNPFNWNHDEMLDYIVGREIKNYINSIVEINETHDQKLENAFLRIKTFATIVNGIRINCDMISYYKEDWEIISSKSSKFESPEEMLFSAGLISRDYKGEYLIEPMLPDLIGEYFVIQEIMKSKACAKSIIDMAWRKQENTYVFFSRLFYDYFNFFESNSNFIKLLLEPSIEDYNENQAIAYALFLSNATKRINYITHEDLIKFVLSMLIDLAIKYNQSDEIITILGMESQWLSGLEMRLYQHTFSLNELNTIMRLKKVIPDDIRMKLKENSNAYLKPLMNTNETY